MCVCRSFGVVEPRSERNHQQPTRHHQHHLNWMRLLDQTNNLDLASKDKLCVCLVEFFFFLLLLPKSIYIDRTTTSIDRQNGKKQQNTNADGRCNEDEDEK